jgi:hypothetical protein
VRRFWYAVFVIALFAGLLGSLVSFLPWTRWVVLALLAWLSWHTFKQQRAFRVQQARLRQFFMEKQLHVPAIKRWSPCHGCPGFELVFGSRDLAKGFADSPHFEGLLPLVDEMLAPGWPRAGAFDARLAVKVSPRL